MNVTQTDQYIKLHIDERHTLLIDLAEDKLYLNGRRIKTTNVIREYKEEFSKEKNRGFFKKHRAAYLSTGKGVFLMEVGYDGRVFFLYWDNYEKFADFRRKPDKQFSYFHDRRAKAKYWYGQNLSLPLGEYKNQDL